MRFKYEASRYFIGQEKLITELAIIAESVKEGENVNLFFKAPSGYGKTTLAYMFLKYVDPDYENSVQYLPNKDGEIFFDERKRFHFIDEIHRIKNPEHLFGYLGSGDYTIILATNEYDKIKATLERRALDFQFESYSISDIALIVQLLFEKKDIELPFSLCREIAKYCRSSPGVAKKYAVRLSFVFNQKGIPSEIEEIHDIMYNYLGTEEGGMTSADKRYLETLNKLGGLAGIKTLTNHLNIAEKTITESIEPFLIERELIKITPRGRKLIWREI